MIDISKFDKAEVLAALYNASKPQGLGFLHYTPEPMSREQAAELLEPPRDCPWPLSFDYLKGRVMKVDLSGDSFNEWGYDRDNGDGAASRALANLKPVKEIA